MADRRVALAPGAGDRSGPGRPGRPAGVAGAFEQARESALPVVGSQRREPVRGEAAAGCGCEARPCDGLMAVDLIGDPLPMCSSVRRGRAPRLARNLGNGQHWLAIELGGYWRVKPELMRTNSHGIGTRVTARRAGGVCSV